MTRKQQLRHYNLEKAEEVVAAKNTQKEELVKSVKSFHYTVAQLGSRQIEMHHNLSFSKLRTS